MKNRRQLFTHGRVSAALAAWSCVGAALVSAGAHAQNADAMQKAAASTVRLAASNARVASDVCGVDAKTVADYKTSVSKQFQEPNFAADWTAGWASGNKTVLNLQQLKARNASEYAEQKNATCKDIKDDMTS